jgi:uncharacterized protein
MPGTALGLQAAPGVRLDDNVGDGALEEDIVLVKPYGFAQAHTGIADQGIADAQFNLALMHHFGEGVPQDDVEAVKWFRLGAEQGDAFAMYDPAFETLG